MCFKLLLLLTSLALTSCTTTALHKPVPAELISQVTVNESFSIRFWGDQKPTVNEKKHDVIKWLKQRSKEWDASESAAKINFLALSGGGEDGSFAAGIITGWTRHGDRPEFDVVTGVSAGALTAPFVFLGPTHDEVLFDVYANLDNKDIYQTQIFSGLFGGSALLDTNPLKALIKKYVTYEILDQIAKQHLKGRRLWIGTTNLDAGRPVIWDIGEIALSGKTNALALVHDILLASSAVPGFFPPVIIDVAVEDQKFTEMHVDGGVTRQAFLYPPHYVEKEFIETIGDDIERKLFIIRNGRSKPVYDPVKESLYSIALKSLSMTIENKAVGDLYRIYQITLQDGIDYNLAIIPETFKLKPNKSFDREYTKALFNLGYTLAKNGFPWEKSPPESD